jgi:hypothetical protein
MQDHVVPVARAAPLALAAPYDGAGRVRFLVAAVTHLASGGGALTADGAGRAHESRSSSSAATGFALAPRCSGITSASRSPGFAHEGWSQ